MDFDQDTDDMPETAVQRGPGLYVVVTAIILLLAVANLGIGDSAPWKVIVVLVVSALFALAVRNNKQHSQIYD